MKTLYEIRHDEETKRDSPQRNRGRREYEGKEQEEVSEKDEEFCARRR